MLTHFRRSLFLFSLAAGVGLVALSVQHISAGCYVQHYDNAANVGCPVADVLSQGPCNLGNCIPPGAGAGYCGDDVLSNTVRTGVSLVDEPGAGGYVMGADYCYRQCDCTGYFLGTVTKTCTGWLCGYASGPCGRTTTTWSAQHTDDTSCTPGA